MKCPICYENMDNDKNIRIFDSEICSMCLSSIGKIDVENIFYDYYKDRIKHIQSSIMKDLI
jgi:hypothetical protein